MTVSKERLLLTRLDRAEISMSWAPANRRTDLSPVRQFIEQSASQGGAEEQASFSSDSDESSRVHRASAPACAPSAEGSAQRPSMSLFATAADYHAAMTEWLASEQMREVGERMAFEAYMKRDKLGLRPTPDGTGSYAVTEVRWAWEAWQARASIAKATEKGGA